MYEYNGELCSIKTISEKTGVAYGVLIYRLNHNWMIAGKTIFIHKRKERPYVQIQWAYGRSFLYCLWRIHTEESLCLA